MCTLWTLLNEVDLYSFEREMLFLVEILIAQDGKAGLVELSEEKKKINKTLQREKIKEDQRKNNHLGFIIIIYEYSHGIIL